MELTEGQKKALDIAVDRYYNGYKYSLIVGPAGTGKSTVVKYIIDAINPEEGDTVYATYTGKAAKVLKQKGNDNTMTLHKLLYEIYPLPDGSFQHRPKRSLNYHVIVVDEASMVSEDMINQLLSYYGIYVIFLGDDAQLPPISGSFNHLFEEPHARLTEIVRQQEDSEIIKCSTAVRNSERLKPNYDGKEMRIYKSEDFNESMLDWADIVLCATNKKRREINSIIRQRKGFDGIPKVGDKIICLKNDWDVFDTDGNPLVNGTIGYITKIELGYWPILKNFNLPNNKLEYYEIDLRTEEGTVFYGLKIDRQIFETGTTTLDAKKMYALKMNKFLKKKKVGEHFEEFDFAYAISVHKSQGSEWNKVLVLEEKFPFDTDEHNKWLYTGITRGKNRVVLVQK